MICPKCKKEGKFIYFDTVDHTGITAVVSHKIGRFEKVKDVFGNERLIEIEERHFLTLDELEKTSWFSDWKKNFDSEMEKAKIDMDKVCEEEYWKSVEREEMK